MNVLQLISSGGFYGAERVVVTLAAELEREGIHAVVGAFRNTAKTIHLEVLEKARQCGLETEEVLCDGRLDRKAVSAIQRLVDWYRIDLIHSHVPKAHLYALLAARNRPVTLVATCHSWHFNSVLERATSFSDRIVLRKFDAVAVVSGSAGEHCRRNGIPERLLTQVPNGIDCRVFHGAARNIRAELGVNGGPMVGVAARLSPEKGLSGLLEAVAAIRDEFPTATFLIAGEGPERESLLAQASRLGILPNVRLLGNRDDMPEFYAALDVFVLPSLVDWMPMAILEAMAAARPVLASAVGAAPQMIQHGQSGMLVAPGDVAGLSEGLRLLLRSQGLRQELGRAARERVLAHFSAASMARRYAGIYESAIDSRKKETCSKNASVASN